MKKIVQLIILTLFLSQCRSIAQETQSKAPIKPEDTEIWKPKVPVITTDAKHQIPSDAIVLFDGTNLEQWTSAKDSKAAKWTLNGDGSMTVKDKTGDIQTKKNFRSIQLHLEWKSPKKVQDKGQSRANTRRF